MLAQDEARKARSEAQAALQAAQDAWASQNQNLAQEQAALQKELQTLATERSALVESIDPADLDLYDQLRREHRGVAVTTISDNACDACGSRLTPAHAQAVRSAGQAARCPTCGRILYGS